MIPTRSVGRWESTCSAGRHCVTQDVIEFPEESFPFTLSGVFSSLALTARTPWRFVVNQWRRVVAGCAFGCISAVALHLVLRDTTFISSFSNKRTCHEN